MRRGLLAEFTSPEALTAAVERLHALGYRAMEAYSPYPLPELDPMLGVPRSRASAVVLLAALAGGAGAYLLQWWINVSDYPLDVGRRPLHSAPAFALITFEMAVLAGAVAGFVAFVLRGGMPVLWHPLFEVEGFERASDDRFFLHVALADPRFSASTLTDALDRLGAERVVRLGVSP